MYAKARTIRRDQTWKRQTYARRSTHPNPPGPTERIAQLKLHFEAGLTCREIAAEIGVSRNAVIGKISRLNFDARQWRRHAAGGAATGNGGSRQLATSVRPVPKLRGQLFRAIQSGPQPPAIVEEMSQSINGHGCTLFELSKERCRWPISTPGAEDFCFCGNPAGRGSALLRRPQPDGLSGGVAVARELNVTLPRTGG